MNAMGKNKQRTTTVADHPDASAPIRPTPSWPAGRAEALIRLWNCGLVTAEIAARLGVTPRAVDSKVRKLRVAGYRLAARRPRCPRTIRRARRKCLHCGALFPSSHIGNRICGTCLEDGPFTGALV